MRKDYGFTTVEMFVLIFMILGLIVFLSFWGSVAMGNFWCSQESIETSLTVDYPEVSKVLKVDRAWIGYTTVHAENQDGSRVTYNLDTNILFNYEFSQ